MPVSPDARPTHGQPAVSLRTLRKLRTSRALQQAALYLFAERGYDETTVADIAARAEVGVRTFFVHFPTKEDVLFDSWREPFPELQRRVVEAPAELSDLAALEFALIQIHESVAADRHLAHQSMQLLIKAASSSSVVRGRRIETDEKLAAAVAQAIARRRKEQRPSIVTVTLAESAVRAHHLAVVEWAAAEPEDLIPILRRYLQALRDLGADPTRVAPLTGRYRTRSPSPARSGA